MWIILAVVCNMGTCNEYPVSRIIYPDEWSCQVQLREYRRNLSTYVKCVQIGR